MALSLEKYRSVDLSEEDGTMKDILTQRIEMQRHRSKAFVNRSNGIPEHLVIEILSWLPVRTLLQLKSVCRSWYAMIKSSHSISKHMRKYYDKEANSRNCLIVKYIPLGGTHQLDVYELLIDKKENQVLAHQKIDTPVYNASLCGPCDGIYFLSCHHSPKRSLWNPALDQVKILPTITWKANFPHDLRFITERYGFGYGSKSKDYKVILIRGYGDRRALVTDKPMSILIYSLKTNSWRHWGDVDKSYNLRKFSSYVFVNGCYHWIGSSPLIADEMLVSFDISAEVYKEIPLPQIKNKRGYGDGQLIVYHDSIGFVFVSTYEVSKDNEKSSVSIWTWNEEVWALMLKIELDFGVWGGIQWREDTLVFVKEFAQLILCDTNTKEIFFLDGPRADGCQNVSAYQESLVSITDFN